MEKTSHSKEGITIGVLEFPIWGIINVFSRKVGLEDRIRRASGLRASHFCLFVVEDIIWHFLLADWILWR